MMDQELDLRDFANVSRLFPLPNFVMFPHVILPLHIFEPRYRQMTEDALAADNLITMIQISPPPRGEHWTEPVPLEQVGCLGRIVQHERLADGRFNLLLLGLKRVRLRKEIPSGKLYRTAEVEILEDLDASQADEPARAELIGLFRQILERRSELDPDIADLLEQASLARPALRHRDPFSCPAPTAETTPARGDLGGPTAGHRSFGAPPGGIRRATFPSFPPTIQHELTCGSGRVLTMPGRAATSRGSRTPSLPWAGSLASKPRASSRHRYEAVQRSVCIDKVLWQ